MTISGLTVAATDDGSYEMYCTTEGTEGDILFTDAIDKAGTLTVKYVYDSSISTTTTKGWRLGFYGKPTSAYRTGFIVGNNAETNTLYYINAKGSTSSALKTLDSDTEITLTITIPTTVIEGSATVSSGTYQIGTNAAVTQSLPRSSNSENSLGGLWVVSPKFRIKYISWEPAE